MNQATRSVINFTSRAWYRACLPYSSSSSMSDSPNRQVDARRFCDNALSENHKCTDPRILSLILDSPDRKDGWQEIWKGPPSRRR